MPVVSADQPASCNAGVLRPFMPELDTLRGIAVLSVLFLHGFYWHYANFSFGRLARTFVALTSPGWLGVNLFFVLSGFLITGILLDSKSRPYYYRRFYTRRALRILPAYYALLLFLLLLHSASPAFVAISFIYLSNVANFFHVAFDYGPLWSLAVEEHFYILWPAVVRRVTMRGLAWVSAGIVVGVPILRAISFTLGRTFGLASYTWFVADGLATGALLAILLRTPITRGQLKRFSGWLFASALFISLAGYHFGILSRSRLLGAAFQWTIIDAFFACVLMLFLLTGSGSARRYVNIPILGFLGYISYGLYLNHLFAFRMYDRICRRFLPQLMPTNGHFSLVLLRFVLAAAGAVAVAYLSRRFFEEWFLQMKDKLVPQSPSVLPVPAATEQTVNSIQVA